MDTTQRLITTLLKAAVTGQAQPLPEGYSLEEAMPIIRKQGLASLAYEGAYVCGISRNEPVMQELFKLYYSILLHSERQMRKVEEVCRAFEENGIDYLPFKGCVLKAMYPRPELRPMGDADILIRAEQYERVVPVMVSMGFELTDVAESVLTWEHKALCLELHRKLYGPSDRDLHDYYANIWEHAVWQSGYRYTFSVEDTFLHMFTHFVKHYRSGGIGCRHVLDLWVYRCMNSEINIAYIEQELQKIHMLEFYNNMMRLLDAWFEGGPKDNIIALMTEWIFSGGAFGDARAEQIFKTLREMENHPKKKNAGFQYYRSILFPGIRQMKYKYPILEKYPFLLPVGWIVRGSAVLIHRRDKLTRTMNIGKSVTDDALQNHKKALHYVGLDFHG